jgi:hypothetical protein
MRVESTSQRVSLGDEEAEKWQTEILERKRVNFENLKVKKKSETILVLEYTMLTQLK